MKDEESKNLADQESFSPFIHWTIKNRKALVIASSTLLVLVICYAIINQKNSLARYQAMKQAENLAENLEQVHPKDPPEEAVSNLIALCEKYPSLSKRYEGIIAQERIIQEKPCEPYATRCIASLHTNELPLFAASSEITLLSEQKKFSEALSKATHLLEGSNSFVLRASILLQIAALQKALQQTQECKKTIEELKEFLKTDPKGDAFLLLVEQPNASLLDFLCS
jgi:hypothetical protein